MPLIANPRRPTGLSPWVFSIFVTIERYRVIQKTNDVNTVKLMNLVGEYNETVYESSSTGRNTVALLNETVNLDESPNVGQARDIAHHIVDTCAKINNNARVFTMWAMV